MEGLSNLVVPATTNSLLSRLTPRTCLFAAVVFLTLILTPPTIDHIDGAYRVRFSEALLRGNLSVQADERFPMFFAAGNDGRTYSIYGLGQPLVLAPLVGLARLVTGADAVGEGGRGLAAEGLVTWLYCAALNLLFAACVLGILREFGIRGRRAPVGTLVLFVATPWVYWGRSLQEETLVATLLAAGVLGILRARGSGLPLGMLLSGLACGFIANVRPNAVFAVLAVIAWMLSISRNRLRDTSLFVGGAAPSLALFFTWNAYRFGSPLTTGWQASGGAAGWSPDFALFLDQIFVPDFGMLWFAPVLVSLAALYLVPRRRRLKPGVFAGLLTGSIIAHAFLLSGLPQYVGHSVGASWGPRYLMHGALIALPLCWLALARARRISWLRRGLVGVFIVCFGLQLVGLSFRVNLEYSQDHYRLEEGLPPMEPYWYVPRRFANLAWWINGELNERSFPGDLPSAPEEDQRVLTTPNITPLRLLRSQRLAKSGGVLAYAALMVWLACLCSAVASVWLLLRRSARAA